MITFIFVISISISGIPTVTYFVSWLRFSEDFNSTTPASFDRDMEGNDAGSLKS